MLSAIIVAAGSSQRMGFDKLFADLGGRPVVAHSVSAFEACGAVDEIVIVTRAEREEDFQKLALDLGWTKLRAILRGGAQRHLSVWNGLQALSAAPVPPDYVAVHDGARPMVTPDMIERCLRVCEESGAACCAVPVSDTLKRADKHGRISGSIDRTHLWAMHTPQIFSFPLLLTAYRSIIEADSTVTDEASAVESLGNPVALVDTGSINLKITYPRDLDSARRLMRKG